MISREGAILLGICVADMVLTLLLVHCMGATEGNPLLRFYLEMGYAPFAAAKLVLSLFPVLVLEIIRRRRPGFVGGLMRAGIVLYLAFYGLGVWHLNVGGVSPHWASLPLVGPLR